jgi:hypothetical protein
MAHLISRVRWAAMSPALGCWPWCSSTNTLMDSPEQAYDGFMGRWQIQKDTGKGHENESRVRVGWRPACASPATRDTVSEIQVLDAIEHRLFDLRIALPDTN